MALNFPNTPADGDIYEGYVWNDTVGAWQSTETGGGSIDASSNPPASPNAGDLWWDSDNGNLYIYYYDGNSSQWVSASDGQVTISNTVPTGYNGQLWWNSTEGQLYVYYNDGTSSQWVSVGGPKVTVQTTPPPGYQGQLWLDSTDGSMYVYYTDPGGVNSQWIGAVSRSGGILQVVSTTKTDTFSATLANGEISSAITGLTATITPRSTSSKILVTVSLSLAAGGNSYAINHILFRDAVAVGVGATAGSRVQVNTGEVAAIAGVSASNSQVLDTPATTSSITYTVKLHASDATTFYVNRSSADTDTTRYARSASTITLMEVAG